MSGASALRNAVKRITHKERAQPSDRKKMGLLEKHKDYKERAADYHKKQFHLKTMHKKAAERNPDEFYYQMNSSQVKNGVHKKTGGKSLDNATIALMKTQDLGYIAMKKSVDDSKIRKIKANLHMIGERKVKSHKVFVENEVEVENFDAAEHFDTSTELLERAYNRPRRRDVDRIVNKDDISTVNPDHFGAAIKAKGGAYTELKQRSKRSKQLKSAFFQLTQQRALSGKGSKRKIKVQDSKSDGGADKADSTEGGVVYKWKRQRSR